MTDRPNVVLVTVDSLRADHCSFAGYDRETTSALDRLAAEGLVFENAVAPGPSTPESMPAVFTGHRITDRERRFDVAGRRGSIRRHMTVRDTFPEALSRAGYATAGFTPNPFTSRYFGFDRGFDRFEDFLDSFVRRTYRRLFERLFGGGDLVAAIRMALNLWQREEVFKPWEAYYDEAIEWCRRAEEPYFLWLHTMDAHVPYIAGGAYRSQHWTTTLRANYRFWREDKKSAFDPVLHDRLLTAYDDSIRYTDALLERLHSDLGDAIVVVHGDHGEAFGEHGTYGHEPYLYEENVHVPFVVGDMSTRERVPARPVSQPVSLCVLPRLLASVGADGVAFDSEAGEFAVSRTRHGNRIALRGQTLKYIRNEDEDREGNETRNGDRSRSGNDEKSRNAIRNRKRDGNENGNGDRPREELYNLARNEHTPVTDERAERACRDRVDTILEAERETRRIQAAARTIEEQ